VITVCFASKFISDHDHGGLSEMIKHCSTRDHWSQGKVVIKNNVWIGEGGFNIIGVTIGENVIVGTYICN
jgi:acetyltransferase-like isoleucine patch superfamily enzyme